MENYFNTLSLRDKLSQLGKCRFMSKDEFIDGCNLLKNWNIVIIGCGAQGLNQGLNMRDSGLNISYALREQAIKEKDNHFYLQMKMALRLEHPKNSYLKQIWYSTLLQINNTQKQSRR